MTILIKCSLFLTDCNLFLFLVHDLRFTMASKRLRRFQVRSILIYLQYLTFIKILFSILDRSSTVDQLSTSFTRSKKSEKLFFTQRFHKQILLRTLHFVVEKAILLNSLYDELDATKTLESLSEYNTISSFIKIQRRSSAEQAKTIKMIQE